MSGRGRLATVFADGATRHGAVVDGGVVDLSGRFANRWPTLREAIADKALGALLDHAAGKPVDFGSGDFQYAIPVPSPEKIICVGVNHRPRRRQ